MSILHTLIWGAKPALLLTLGLAILPGKAVWAQPHAKLSQSFAKCWLGVNKSESGGSFSCPDADASSVSAKARSSQAKNICKACGRKNGCGHGDDIAPATIGFPLQCPAIGSCGGSIQTLQDVASCSACVAGVVADGAARNSIPAFTTPPPQCVTLPMSPTH